jgi:ribonuclease-3 family protein
LEHYKITEPQINKRWQDVNILLLAYLGDAVYELWVANICWAWDPRSKKCIGSCPVCSGQEPGGLLHSLMDELDETETEVVKRGRNAKGHHPRNVDVMTYRHATAFEALIGYWYLTGKRQE